MAEWLATYHHVIEAFIIVLGTLVIRYGVQVLTKRLAARLARTSNIYDDALVEAARGPVGTLIWMLGVLWALEALGTDTDLVLLEYVPILRQLTVVTTVAWYAVRFIRFIERHVADDSYGPRNIDRTTASAIGKILRAAVIITAALTALQIMGMSISGVIAFGGVGGIAVGFASRDLLANFFGALMIFLDRPFSVGDWIRSPDRDIEGTVEEIGWRLTRIRTFDQRPLYVPNSIFTTIAVENPSRMRNRRIYEKIGVRYVDIDALPQIVTDVREMLVAHPDIETSRTLMVHFNTFADSALEFFVYTFTRTTAWAEYHAVKEDVLLKISGIIAGHGAEIAFPTRTVVLESAAGGPPVP
jgi:MscS family membrane protein